MKENRLALVKVIDETTRSNKPLGSILKGTVAATSDERLKDLMALNIPEMLPDEEVVTREELRMELEQLDDGEIVSCILSDGMDIEIGTSNYWVGGVKGSYGCDLLGNSAYGTIDLLLHDLYDFLKEDDRTISEII